MSSTGATSESTKVTTEVRLTLGTRTPHIPCVGRNTRQRGEPETSESVTSVNRAYKTVSNESVCVLAEMIPLDHLPGEKNFLYHGRGANSFAMCSDFRKVTGKELNWR